MDHICIVCGESFTDEWLLIAHREIFHDSAYPCRSSVIQYAPPSFSDYNQPSTSSENNKPSTSSNDNIEIFAEALEGKVVRHFKIRNNSKLNLENFVREASVLINGILQDELRRLNFIKFGIVLDTSFVNAQNETSTRGFITKNRQLMVSSDKMQLLTDCFEEIKTKITEHESLGSGWSLLSVIGCDLRVHKHGYGDRGSSFIELPKKIQNTKSCINVHNYDNQCFKYAMLCKFVKNETDVLQPNAKYQQYSNKYNFNGLQYPVSLKDVESFERKNPTVTVNVFGLDDRNNVYPLKVVKVEKLDHTDLLLIKKGNISHYVYIKNFNRLMHSQITKHCAAVTVCKRCFAHVNKSLNRGGKKWLFDHNYFCNKQEPVKTVIPHQSQSIVQFKKISHQYRVPIVIYADMESTLVGVPNTNNTQGSIKKYQSHQPNSYCLLLKSYLSEIDLNNCGLSSKPFVYRGEHAAKKLLDHLYEIARKVEILYSYKVPMCVMSDYEIAQYNSKTECYICHLPFTVGNIKVRDHDHLTGKFRGAACNGCNLNFKLPKFIPIVFHNLSNYDAHFIIPELGKDNGAIDVLATSSEKFISFSKKVNSLKLRFIDSFRFLPYSLMSLTKNLSRNELIETKKLVPHDKLDLVLQKGVFPYDYIDCAARFNETSLPPRKAFYNKLTECKLSKKDFNHACKVWTELNIKTLGEYSDFYVTLDVTLLADIMENFRNTSIQAYELDPLHSYTCPGFAWQAMLKETKCRLELLTDIDMILMVEAGVRGGLTQSVTRYIKANNKYLPNYDPTEESIYVGHFDANNNYGWAMQFFLPYGDFKWIRAQDLEDIAKIPQDGKKGYILDCDYVYPQTLHDHHYDLPFLPNNEKPPEGKYNKLMMTLENKNRYIAHYMTVQQALQSGIQISKVHRVLEFSQSPWLEPYIVGNTVRRTNATTKLQKDFFKLMNNSVFGKFLENKRKHKNVKLVTNAKQLTKLVQKPNFQTSIIINENLVAVSMKKTSVKLDRPLYVGMCILDISKLLLYDFHYNKMVNYYGREKIGISYMDTDSFLYWIKTEDMYEDLKLFPYRNEFDFSDYPKQHPTYDNDVNKKVLGKFKDEYCGTPIVEAVALMSKMYAIQLLPTPKENGEESEDGEDTEEEENSCVIKKAKGIKSSYVKNKLMFDDYKKCLFEKLTYKATYNNIRSYNHQLYSITETKTSLTSIDNKRKLLSDHIHTLPYGHYSLQN